MKFASLALAVSLTLASTAHALVGVFTGGALGFAFAAIGGVHLYEGAETKNPRMDPSVGSIKFAFLAAGLVLLDEKNEVLRFQALDEKAARKIGMNESERVSYNRELPQINLAFDATVADVQALEKSGRAPQLSDARAAWAKRSREAGLSAESMNALVNIVGVARQNAK